MRNKTPLALMEQVVMVLVFALAAALCLRVFVFADQRSEKNAAMDMAVTVCQTAAETLKSCGGNVAHAQAGAVSVLGGTVEQGLWYIFYDEAWTQVDDISSVVYGLYAQGVPADVDGLSRVEVWVESCGENGERLFSIPVAWQEVRGNG